MNNGSDFGERPQPHWMWALLLVVVPTGLFLIGLFGLSPASPFSIGLASGAPQAAVAITVAGMAAAMFHRRRQPWARQPLAIALAGLVISALGMLLLWSLAHTS